LQPHCLPFQPPDCLFFYAPLPVLYVAPCQSFLASLPAFSAPLLPVFF
jgi:hypothetical protein